MNAISKTPPKPRLRAVAPKTATPSKPKTLIFGAAGVGKTWASLDFPSVYYIDTEGGADLSHYTEKLERSGGVYLGIDQGSLSFETVLEQVQALATEKHNYRTLVIDSVTKVFNLAITDESERLGDKDVYGASKKPATRYMSRLVSWLMKLDMNVILIAHEKDEYGENEKGQREVIGKTFDCWEKLAYELHLNLHITKRGNSRYAQVRKTRLTGFPDRASFPWSYSEFAERYGREVLEREATQIELASADQVAEIERLLKTVRVADDYRTKVLNAAGAETFAEMDAAKAAAVITQLHGKITGEA